METTADRWGTPPRDENAAAFAALMREPDERVPLDRAATLLARGIAYRHLDVQEILDQLDVLALGLRERLADERAPLAAVTALCDYLGRDLGFRAPRGGEDDYYDPRNSFLNDVLGRRIGIPIGLSLVYLEVARRVDIPLVGVGLPWHFVVKYPLGDDPHDAIFLDPFAGGALLTPAELRARFEAQSQGRVPYAEHFLGAVTKKQLLTRSLHNLRGIYAARNNVRSLMIVLDYLLLIAPWDLDTRRERGMLALRIGEADRALADLQVYVDYSPDDPNLPLINSYIETLRRRFTLDG